MSSSLPQVFQLFTMSSCPWRPPHQLSFYNYFSISYFFFNMFGSILLTFFKWFFSFRAGWPNLLTASLNSMCMGILCVTILHTCRVVQVGRVWYGILQWSYHCFGVWFLTSRRTPCRWCCIFLPSPMLFLIMPTHQRHESLSSTSTWGSWWLFISIESLYDISLPSTGVPSLLARARPYSPNANPWSRSHAASSGLDQWQLDQIVCARSDKSNKQLRHRLRQGSYLSTCFNVCIPSVFDRVSGVLERSACHYWIFEHIAHVIVIFQWLVGANIDFRGIFRHLFVITQTVKEHWKNSGRAWLVKWGKFVQDASGCIPARAPPSYYCRPPPPPTDIVALLGTECCFMFVYNGMFCTLQNCNDSSDRGATCALLQHLWERFWIPQRDAMEIGRHQRCRPRLGSMSYVNMLARLEECTREKKWASQAKKQTNMLLTVVQQIICNQHRLGLQTKEKQGAKRIGLKTVRKRTRPQRKMEQHGLPRHCENCVRKTRLSQSPVVTQYVLGSDSE